jgi:hypothetical protein
MEIEVLGHNVIVSGEPARQVGGLIKLLLLIQSVKSIFKLLLFCFIASIRAMAINIKSKHTKNDTSSYKTPKMDVFLLLDPDCKLSVVCLRFWGFDGGCNFGLNLYNTCLIDFDNFMAMAGVFFWE